tara:strand:+ start:1457 stop:1648 length:192 start_codon:yes stop_codon:yes gene_type:complete
LLVKLLGGIEIVVVLVFGSVLTLSFVIQLLVKLLGGIEIVVVLGFGPVLTLSFVIELLFTHRI